MEDPAAVALPAALSAQQTEVPEGGNGVWAVQEAPQGGVHWTLQVLQREALYTTAEWMLDQFVLQNTKQFWLMVHS